MVFGARLDKMKLDFRKFDVVYQVLISPSNIVFGIVFVMKNTLDYP